MSHPIGHPEFQDNPMSRPVTEDERALLTHVSMHGSAGYPVEKLRRSKGWTWSFRSIQGPPVIFKARRQAVASFEAFLAVLRQTSGEEAQRRAIREHLAAGQSPHALAKEMSALGAGTVSACLALIRSTYWSA